ncbi:DUF4235 domain-containing protein [Aeromicrobium sp.]|uniref:DUF4235 domain-containing protein n=1 Tax=Aeromicrobium sp. TaxID=1871063 RepID=UPI00351327B5
MARTSRKARKAPSLETATPPRKASRSSRTSWKLLDRSTTIAAGLLARQASTFTWRLATGRKPPTAGRHPDVETKEAVAWAVVGGALVEVVRLLVRRGAAGYWVRSTGDLPPGMKPLKGASVGTRVAAAAGTTEPAPSRKPARRRRRSR